MKNRGFDTMAENTLRRYGAVTLLCLLVGIIAVHAQQKEQKPVAQALPFTMPEIKDPVFPNRTISIADHGAVGDGLTLNTKAFAEAIQACADAGGGTVVVPPGTWLTGPIGLENNVNLHVDRGALVQFSSRFEDYPLIAGLDGKSGKYMLTPPIHGYKLKNIAITGPGMFDGAGEVWRPVKKDKLTAKQWKDLVASGGVVSADGKIWWPSKEAMEGEDLLKELGSGKRGTPEEYAKAREYLRPNLVLLMRCTGILIDGPTFRNSPKFHINPQQCENLIIRNASVACWWYAQNGDGIDLGSCRNVIIDNCTIDAGDDAICLKPGKLGPSQEPGPACSNIVVSNCVVYHGHGGFVIGSESYGGVSNVAVRNCIFSGTDVGLRFKSGRGRGGLVENVFVENVRMRDIAEEAILFDMYYNDQAPEDRAKAEARQQKSPAVEERTPRFQAFRISNIVCDGAGKALVINGLPEMAVKDITIENSYLKADKGVLMNEAEGITLKNVTIIPKSGDIIGVSQGTNILLDSVKFPKGTAKFLTVSGEKSSGIRLQNTVLADPSGMISLSPGVRPDAVVK